LVSFQLTTEQSFILNHLKGKKTFLEGIAGTGKTTVGVAYLDQLFNSGVNTSSILILVPQRTLAFPYSDFLRQPGLPPGGTADILTMGGLAQRMIALFWPLISEKAGFAHPEKPPIFLTLETAQYYMARIVSPRLEKGYFNSVTIESTRIYSQILDNLNKSALVGFSHELIAEKLLRSWIGKPEQTRIYTEAQECADLFRQYCLANNLLDFSLQLQTFVQFLWPSHLFQQYLRGKYRHLIYDNVEEDAPVAHDLVLDWLPNFDSSLVIYDQDAGYRIFLGADPESGYRLKQMCPQKAHLDYSFTNSADQAEFIQSMRDSIHRELPDKLQEEIRSVFQISFLKYHPDMIDWVCSTIHELISDGTPAGQISILSPFLTDSQRFSMMNRLEGSGIPVLSHRPSRSLREEPPTQCLLSLAKLAHPQWNLDITQYEIRYMLMQAIDGLDLVRADLLARIAFRSSSDINQMNSFDQIKPDMQKRITYSVGERYEFLRNWLMDYSKGVPLALDIFLSKLFGEILSQHGFGFHGRYDAADNTARLIESIQKFRFMAMEISEFGLDEIGKEYVQMLMQGVVAAQSLQSWERSTAEAVFLAPAYTFLMQNRPVRYQFWLDIGSLGWWERLNQPLTQPYVLSRNWPGMQKWTDINEYSTNQDTLVRLITGLIRRCTGKIFLCATSYNELGENTKGPLLKALQNMMRRLPSDQVEHV
jgi:hypothetical protein